jgi:uncharacterized protein YceK
MKTLLVIVAAVSLLAGCATAPHHTQAWEYKVVSANAYGDLESRLNKEAADGWEVVSSSNRDAVGIVVLKRAKK